MTGKKSHLTTIFWQWVQITLSVFFLLIAIILILLPFLTILQVPSFRLGNSDIWLLDWQNTQPVGFNIGFNAVMLLAIASIIGVIVIIFRQQKR